MAATQINTSSVCLGSSCLNPADINTLKLVNSQVNSTTLCLSGQCLSSNDISLIKAVLNQVNSTSLCVGNVCLNSTDISLIKNIPTRVNTSSLCAGATCLIQSDVVNLRNTIDQVNSTAVCVSGKCLNATDFSQVLSIQRKPYGVFSLTWAGPCTGGCWIYFTPVFANRITTSGQDFVLPEAGVYSFWTKMNANFNSNSTCVLRLEMWVGSLMYQSITSTPTVSTDTEYYNFAYVYAPNNNTKVGYAAASSCRWTFETSSIWSRVMIEKISGG